MTTPILKSNRELFGYLVALSDHLQSKGESELARIIKTASRFASGSQTEFLFAAEAALTRVRASRAEALDQEQIAAITGVLQQIQVAFIKVGGA